MKHILLVPVTLLLSVWCYGKSILSGVLPKETNVSYHLFIKELRTTSAIDNPIEMEITAGPNNRYQFDVSINKPTFFNLSIVVESNNGHKTNSNTVLYLEPKQHLKLSYLMQGNMVIRPNYQKVNNKNNKLLIEIQHRLMELNRELYYQKFEPIQGKTMLNRFYQLSDSILSKHRIHPEVRKYIQFYTFDEYNAALYRNSMELSKKEKADNSTYYTQPKDPLYFFNDPMLLGFYTGISNIINYLDIACGMRPYSQRKSLAEIKKQYDILDKLITNGETKDQVLARLLGNYVTRYQAGDSFEQDLEAYKETAVNINNEELRTQNIRSFENLRYTLPGADCPPIPLIKSSGDTLSLNDYKGKYLLIDLWASWCVPCIKMMPHLQALEKAYADENIVFVALSIDSDRLKWLNKINELHLEGHQLLDQKGEFARLLNVTGIPHYMLYDPQGKLIHYKTATPDSQQLKELLDSYL